MWSYYGAKTNVVKLYPKPKFNKIIEPFAGSAQYSLRYFDRDVLLVDKYEVIVKIWKWLQKCSVGDILKLPRFKQGDKIDDFTFDCEEAKLLMSFFMGFSSPSPRKTGTNKLTTRPNYVNFNLHKIANSLFKIRHWEIRLGDYSEVENQEATWFIDPPYQFAGKYVHNSAAINFKDLGDWCKTRIGQVMVCDCHGADWLDFKPFAEHTTKNGVQREVIWTNQPTVWNSQRQEKLFA